jgi:hypothetical protein
MKLISAVLALGASLIGLSIFHRPHRRMSDCPRRSYEFPPPEGTEVEILASWDRWIPATYNGQDDRGYYLCDYHNGHGNYAFEREQIRFRLHLVPKQEAA